MKRMRMASLHQAMAPTGREQIVIQAILAVARGNHPGWGWAIIRIGNRKRGI
jgi:hypothetical protein